MAFDRFMIAPYSTGLESDLKPFLLPEDAFTRLNNAYIFRGRIKKRFGSKLMGSSQLTSRLRIKIGTTDGNGKIGVAPTVKVPGTRFDIGQMFSIGSEIFTVYQDGDMKTTGSATTHTYNTTTGYVVIEGAAANTDVYFYPADPVMGLLTYEQIEINDEKLIAFDRQFAYEYKTSGWDRFGSAEWTSTDYQFFWGCSFRGNLNNTTYLYVTNNNKTDHIKYYDGSAWNVLEPLYEGATYKIKSARMVLPFKNRLLLLNVLQETSSGDKEFVNRIVYSQNGDPSDNNTSFRRDLKLGAGWIETTTKEAIISAQVIRDRLIVFCESSTLELVYTGNNADPFIFVQLNEELGVESTFSTVLFDKHVIGVGNVGIHACNGAAVERIDEKIPQEVFNISSDNNGIDRVFGIRDYYTEMIYWTFPSTEDSSKFPRRVFVFNYKNGAWAFNDDSITCFGYYQNASGITWSEMGMTWAECNAAWSDGAFDYLYRNVIAGNQQGWLQIIEPDTGRNSPSLQVSNIYDSLSHPGKVGILCKNHNLKEGDFVVLEDSTSSAIYEVLYKNDDDNLTLEAIYISATYKGGATLARVSRMEIYTKHYSFYQKQGKNIYIPTIEFLVDKTKSGQITVDISTSSSNILLVGDGVVSGALLGSGILETSPYPTVEYEATQDRFWHRYYPQATGESVQLKMYLSDEQIVVPAVAFSTFELNAMVFYASPISR